jgi:hypothetical protein
VRIQVSRARFPNASVRTRMYLAKHFKFEYQCSPTRHGSLLRLSCNTRYTTSKRPRDVSAPPKNARHICTTTHPACPSGTPHFAVLYHEAGTRSASSQPLVRALVRLCRRVGIRHDSLVGVIVPAQGDTTGRAVQSLVVNVAASEYLASFKLHCVIMCYVYRDGWDQVMRLKFMKKVNESLRGRRHCKIDTCFMQISPGNLGNQPCSENSSWLKSLRLQARYQILTVTSRSLPSRF